MRSRLERKYTLGTKIAWNVLYHIRHDSKVEVRISMRIKTKDRKMDRLNNDPLCLPSNENSYDVTGIEIAHSQVNLCSNF